jgi:hypothetical protein
VKDPERPTDRVLLWQLRSHVGVLMFGALEDGTVFQHMPNQGWHTLVVGPTDVEASFDLAVGATKAAEGQGARLTSGPVEFGIDGKVAGAIRADRDWNGTEHVLMIGFQMAAQVRR